MGRCVLLPDHGEHWVSPFDDAQSGAFTYRTPCSLRKMSETARLSSFPGREVQRYGSTHTRPSSIGAVVHVGGPSRSWMVSLALFVTSIGVELAHVF